MFQKKPIINMPWAILWIRQLIKNSQPIRKAITQMAQFLKLNDLLTDTDYTVTDEVKQAFLDHGLVQQYNSQETEKTSK